MGIITFFGVIVTLKLSSPIFKACLSKKGGMGVDIRSIGSWRRTEHANAVSVPVACDILSHHYMLCCIIATLLNARSTYPQDIHN